MPVATITTPASTDRAPPRMRRLAPRASSTRSSAAPVWMTTPRRRSQPSSTSAAAVLSMRGKTWGSRSTRVSRQPACSSGLTMVKAMKPAPTMATSAPGWIAARRASVSARVQWSYTPGPSMPGTGGRTAEEQVVVIDAAAALQLEAPGGAIQAGGAAAQLELDPEAGQPIGGDGVDVGLGDLGAEVVGQDHAGVRRLGRDEGHIGIGLEAEEGGDGVEAGRAGAQDDVLHGPTAARSRRARSAAKPPSQSATSPSIHSMAWTGQARAQAGSPPHRLHLNALCASRSRKMVP